jgi:hypothetical protein
MSLYTLVYSSGICCYACQALLTIYLSAEADLRGEDELQCKLGRESQGICAWNGFGASCLWLQQKGQTPCFHI